MDSNQVRRAVKGAAAGLLHYSGLRHALTHVRRSQAGGRRVLIVAYHRPVEDFASEVQRSIPGTLISHTTLRRHLEDAHSAGYEFAPMNQAIDVLSGQRTAKKDLLVVTFDDGYRDVYRHAYPILKSMGVPAMVYLPSEYVGTNRRFNHDRLFHLIRVARERHHTPRYEELPTAARQLLGPIFLLGQSASASLDDFLGVHPTATLTRIIDGLEAQLGGGPELVPSYGDVMTWDEVRAMARTGTQFGGHTQNHSVLTLESAENVTREIRASKERIERELGSTIDSFAYCNGWYSDEVIQALARNGFRSAVTTEDLLNRMGGDPFTLKRKVLWENFSLGLSGGYSSPLTTCHLDDVFGLLSVSHPVRGKRTQQPREVSVAV